jgi:hypothetical protein
MAHLADIVKRLERRLDSVAPQVDPAAAQGEVPAIIDGGALPAIAAREAGRAQHPVVAAGDLAPDQRPIARGLMRFLRSRTATGLAAAAAVLVLTQLVPRVWRDGKSETNERTRSTRAPRVRGYEDSGGAELLHRILENADADSKATDEPLDVAYLAGLAGAMRSLADEVEATPEGVGERVVELRLMCSLLLREPPERLTQASRDALLKIARSAADGADGIRHDLEARAKPEALAERFKALVGATVKQLNELREGSASRAR